MGEYVKIFPTTIGRFYNDDHEQTKEVIRNIVTSSHYEENIEGPARHFFESKLDALDQPGLESLKEFVINCANDYAHDVYGIDRNIIITGSWINQTSAGFTQKVHNHGNSYFSGTYYVNYDPDFHSAIDFYKDVEKKSNMPFIYQNPNVYNEYNCKGWRMQDLKEGELVIWPSHLEHGYDPNKGDHRVSISMNFMPEYLDNGSYTFKVSKND